MLAKYKPETRLIHHIIHLKSIRDWANFTSQKNSSYKILDVSPESNEEEIKHNYHFLMRILHPNSQFDYKTNVDQRIYMAIQKSYLQLSRSSSRISYDNEQNSGLHMYMWLLFIVSGVCLHFVILPIIKKRKMESGKFNDNWHVK